MFLKMSVYYLHKWAKWQEVTDHGELSSKPNWMPKQDKIQFVVKKVRKKLANSQTKLLSKAGRLCLIRSTVSTYYMQASFLPKATLNSIDKTCNDFLWGDTVDMKRIHLVNHKTTFLPKEKEGLGIRDQAAQQSLKG